MSDSKVVLITGAAAGIGRATAVHFANGGYKKLALVDIDGEGLATCAAECKAKGVERVLVEVADISDQTAVAQIVPKVVKEFGRLDVLVNNAGICPAQVPFADTQLDMARRIMDVNYFGPFALTQSAIPHLRETKGNVVFVASTAGLKAEKDVSAYCASKAAILALSKSVALEEGEKGVRSNAVCPWGTATNLVTFNQEGVTIDNVNDYVAHKKYNLACRLGRPEEVARAIAFLASEDSEFITGTHILVDGGAHTK